MGRDLGGRFKREGTYVYLQLIHVDVWQKPMQYCKAIIFQLKKPKQPAQVLLMQPACGNGEALI